MKVGYVQTLILGIESSCDETAAAVVADGQRILSSVVASQLDTHAKYGGVVPELASREHLRAIVAVVRQALENSSVDLAKLDAIAVTAGPWFSGFIAGRCDLRQSALLCAQNSACGGESCGGAHPFRVA